MKPERISELDGQPLAPWRQHLLDAAAYMEERGHTKHSFETPSGVCILGAVYGTYRKGMPCVSRTVPLLRAYIRKQYGVGAAQWNDRPETTKQMAVDALIGAALAR